MCDYLNQYFYIIWIAEEITAVLVVECDHISNEMISSSFGQWKVAVKSEL